MAGYGIDEARSAGYSDAQILSALSSDEFSHLGINDAISAGYSPSQILGALAPAPAPEPQKESGDFMRGAGEAFQQVPQLGYGLLAGAGAIAENVVGEGGIATSIKEKGVEGFQRWGEKVAEGSKESDSWSTSYERAKEGDFGSLVDWFQHGLGYAAGQGVQILATGGVGALGAKAAGVGASKLAAGMVAKESAKIAATKEGATMAAEQIAKMATANVASKIGQNTALAATAFGMEGGEIYGDLVSTAQKEGRDLTGSELGKAFVSTIGAGGLEFVGDRIGLDLMLGKKIAGIGGVGGKAARATAGGAVGLIGEGLTEYAQTGIEEYGKGKEANILPFMQSEAAQRQAIDAAALGGLGGTAMGGVGGALSKPQSTDPSDTINTVLNAGNTGDPAQDLNASIATMNDIVGADISTLEDIEPSLPTLPPKEAANVIPGTLTTPESYSGTLGIAGDVVSQQPGTGLGNANIGRGNIGLGSGVAITGTQPQDGSTIPAGGQTALPGGAAVAQQLISEISAQGAIMRDKSLPDAERISAKANQDAAYAKLDALNAQTKLGENIPPNAPAVDRGQPTVNSDLAITPATTSQQQEAKAAESLIHKKPPINSAKPVETSKNDELIAKNTPVLQAGTIKTLSDGRYAAVGFTREQIRAASPSAFIDGKGNGIFPAKTNKIQLERALGISTIPEGAILADGDQPFSKRKQALMVLNSTNGMKKTHKIIPVDGGYAIAPLAKDEPAVKTEVEVAERNAVINKMRPASRMVAMTGERLTNDFNRTELARMKAEFGWAERGGKLIRGMDGEAASRTKWVPMDERRLWESRPKGVTEAEAPGMVDAALNGKPLSAAGHRFINYLLDVAQEREKQLSALEIEVEKAEDNLTDAENDALNSLMVEAESLIGNDEAQKIYDRHENYAVTDGVRAWYDSLTFALQNQIEFTRTQNERTGQTQQAVAGVAEEGNQAGRAEIGAQGNAQGLSLTGQTNAEILAQERAAAKAAEDAAKETPAKNVTTDQADLFNTQGALFNSNRDQPTAEIKPSQEQQATAILDRANVTGKDRLDIMRDFKDGKHSLADLEAAYPAAEPKPSQEPKAEQAVIYHGSPVASTVQDFRPSSGGELGAGLYFSFERDYAADYAKPRGEVYSASESAKTSSVIALDASRIKLKEITKAQFLKDRAALYDAEQNANGGKWDMDVARRAEKKLIEKYQSEGFDGLHESDEKQGVVFPDSIAKLSRFAKSATDKAEQASGEGGTLSNKSILDDPSPEEAQAVERGIEGKSAVEAAEFIAKNAPDESHRLIAQKVAVRLRELESVGAVFNLHIAHIGDSIPESMSQAGVRGQVIQIGGEVETNIWIQGADATGKVGVSYEVVLHELVHAATQKAIDLGVHDEAGSELRGYAEDLHGIYAHVLNQIAQKDKAGESLNTFESHFLSGRNNSLANSHELVSWALTNKETQAYLDAIPYKKTTVWGEFVTAIRKMLGLNANEETALSEVLRITDRLMSVDAGNLLLASLRQKVNMAQSMRENYPHRSIVNSTKAASGEGAQNEPKFSQSQSKARNPHTLSTLTDAIDKAMGQGFTKLLELTGKFKIISSAEADLILKQTSAFKGGSDALSSNANSSANRGHAGSRFTHGNGEINIPLNAESRGGDVNPPANKRSADVNFISPESISNLLKTPAFKIHGFSGLDVKTKDAVLQQMVFAGHNGKILNSVIGFIPVDVMNVLRDEQLTPEMLFHDKSMLSDLLSGDGVFRGNVSLVSISSFIRNTATFGAKTKGSLVAEMVSEKGLPAISANHFFLGSRPNSETFAGTENSSSGLDVARPFKDRFTADATGTIDLRHDITPSSDVILGTGGVSALPVPTIIHNNRVLAFVSQGKTYLISDNISQTDDNVKGLLTHEISSHALLLGLSEPEYLKIVHRFKAMARIGNKKAQAGFDRVPKDTPAHLVDQEGLSYFLEANPDLPLTKQFVAWFRSMLRKLGANIKGMDKVRWVQWANKISESDIIYMASQALRSAPQTLATAQDRGTFLAGASDKLYSQLRVAIRDMNDKIFQGSAVNVRLHLMNNLGKYGIKKDEIFWTGLEDYLNMPGKVSKADVLAFLDENAMVTKDVVLGERGGKDAEKEIEQKYKESLEQEASDTDGDFWYETLKDQARKEGVETSDLSQIERDELLDRAMPFDERVAEIKSAFGTEIKQRIEDQVNDEASYDNSEYNDTKFPTQVLPGGRDYRELLITLPVKKHYIPYDDWLKTKSFNDTKENGEEYIRQMKLKPDVPFKSSHYPDHPNLIAHVRLDTRDDAQGRTGTFLEEQQSDWQIAQSKNKDAPKAPFVTSATGKGSTAHTLLSMKKVILHAIEQGHEFISWTTGTQQKDRYSLSKRVDKIEATERNSKGERNVFIYPKGEGEIRLFVNNDGVVEGGKFADKRLDEVVGKDISDKILAAENAQEYTGLDLDIGGEWADSLYGDENGLDANGKPSLMSQAVKEVARQLGIELRVEPIDIFGKPKQPEFIAPGIGINKLPEGSQPGFTVTPELRSKVTSAGMPLFSKQQHIQGTERTSVLNDPSKEEAEAVQRGIEGKSAVEAAQFIADNATEPSHRIIAERVAIRLAQLQDAGSKFTLHVSHVGGKIPNTMLQAGVRGQVYQNESDPETHIWINGADVTGVVGTSYELVLHELIHAATQKAIDLGDRGAKGEIGEVVADLNKAFAAITDSIRARLANGGELTAFEKEFDTYRNNSLLNTHELISWSLTNKEMQNYLESIPYKKTNLWSEFVTVVRKFLGLNADSETVLSEVLRVADRLLSINITAMKMNAIFKNQHMAINYERSSADGSYRGIRNSAVGQQSIPGAAQPPAQPPRPIVESLAQEYGRPMGELLNMFDRNQIVQMYEKSLPELRDYKHEQEAIVADRNKAMYEADGFLDKLRAVPMALRDKFATLAHEATIAGIDPSEEYQDNDQTKELRRMESILEERAKEGALPDSQKALLKHTKRLLADVPETYRKLRVQFQTMSKEQRELFVALRDQYRENGKRVFDAFAERVERMKASPEAKASAIQELRAQYDKMKKGIYFPLARFGDHVLIGTKEIDGIKTRTVEYYETEKAANEARRRMAKDGYQTKISKRKDAIADSGANKALAGVIEKVRSLQESGGVAGKAELDLLLDGLNQSMIQMLPDQSYRRHFMHRKNTPGYSADFIRAYADSMWHSASHIAGLKHGDKVTASIEAMQNRIDSEQTGDTSALQDVVNHLIYREERLREGTNKTVAFIGQAGFLSALASVSNFFINLTQTPMLTLPHLGGRYGFGQASMQLLSGLNAQVRAMKTAKTLTDMKHVMDIRNRLQGVEKDLMTRLHDMGKIDLSGSHDLIDAANRDAPRPDSAWDVAMRVAAFPQHASEVINRQVTALAAIRLEMKKSGNIDDALNAAVEAIDQTHYDYEKSNRAMLMHGNTQRVIFMFKQYAQKTAFLWARTAYLAVGGDNASPEVKKIARKQLAGMVAMQAALSGVLGLPIFLEAGVVASGVVGFKLGGKTGAYLGVAGAAILIAISAATDDDEDEFDAEVRKALSGMAGKEWGEVLARGAVRLTGVDISGRVNVDELFIRKPDKSVEGKDARLAWMDAILGYAIGGQAANIYTGLSMMGDGYIYRGAEKIMPVKALRDLMQAGRLAKDGLTTMKGDKLVDDLNMGQIATKALGFQPAEVAEAYERNAAIKGAETILNDQRIKLLDKRWALKQDNDAEGLKDNWADIQEFNKEHPTHRILMQDVYKSFAARKRANQKQVGGITVSRKHKELRDKGSFANVD